jgi:diguanylate cyclase (GGDEF)-like protein
MEHVLFFAVKGFLLIGMLLLGLSLLPVKRMIRQLPKGPIRRRWYMLAGMIAVFFAGYAILFYTINYSVINIIVSSAFFVGACFVLMVTTLTLQTTSDVKRDAVHEKENITDPLTNLYNRRYIDSRFAAEMSRVQRYGLEISVLMIDIDNFKSINETYGHSTGDAVLRNISALVRNASRNADIVGRFGGEEFILIAPSTPIREAEILAERLCRLIDFSLLLNVSETGGKPVPHITVSIGVASLSAQVTDVETLTAAVEGALLRAKQEGRNRVVIAQA